MSILIGGSASTGSSVLCQILNRHSLLFCGPETYLFTKTQFYKNWEGTKSRILKKNIRGIKSDSWHLYNGVDLNSSVYELDKTAILQMIKNSTTFSDFINSFFSFQLEKNGKNKWIEKTPSNSYMFQDFLDNFPNAKIILTVRDPYDIMASLLARGIEPYYASGICILNNLVCSHLWNHEQMFTLKYEDLVLNTRAVISKLCSFIGIEIEEGMFESTEKDIKMAGWNYSETQPLNIGSVGRFDQLDPKKQDLTKYLLSTLRPSDSFIGKWGIQSEKMKDYCSFFDYEYRPNFSSFRQYTRLAKIKDQFVRFFRAYPNSFSNYPLQMVT